ncbi:MAG: RidA family protein [Lachnospiraceae bacterium]|nr:RidA family protein [Lachnospiraceae bacterium]
MKAEERIAALGIDLPAGSKPAAKYVPAVRTGNLIFVSGQIPTKDGKLAYTGKAGGALTLEDVQAAARLCMINGLAALKAELGDLDRVKRIVKLQAFVATENGFDKQHLVANAASELLGDVFGDAGVHARTAVGVNQLPMDAAVEVELIAEVE